MPASRADLLRPLPSLTEVRNRTPAADEELRCRSNHLVNKALLRPIEPGVPAAGETDIAAFAPAPPRLFAADVTNVISARVADTPSTPCGYPAVSVKHSKQEAGKSFRAKSLRCTTPHSRDGRNRQRNTDH